MLRYLLPLLLLTLPARAQQPDKTFSPYFYLGDSSAALPLLHTGAEVQIAGIIADVKVVQVYRNSGKKPLEAIYVFPASTRAAVYAMSMKIGRRSIRAEIRERQQARNDYQAAKAEGKTASLLEQDRPNIFQMNVANIMPGDSITVELSYTETIVPVEGIYEFVYPAVAGPRYNSVHDLDPLVSRNASQPSAAGLMPVPTQPENQLPLFSFGMRVEISTGVPVQYLNSPSHKTQISFESADAATVLLAPEEAQGGNRDFVLRYKLAGNTVQNGLITCRGNGENFFLFTMQPPKRITPQEITPREYIFVMDVSGSMNGYPIETSKQLLRDLVGSLKETDRFNLVLFAGYANILSAHSLPATAANIDSAVLLMGKQSGAGGTELKNAMERAMNIPRLENYARSIVICTDGLIGNEASVYESIRKNLGNTSVFAFGIGSSVNRFLIEGLAHCGSGEPFVVLQQAESQSVAEKFRRYVSSPVLTNIEVDFGAMQVYDLEPFAVPDLFAEKPIVICGKYRGSTETSITVSGRSGKSEYKSTIDVRKVRPRDRNKAIRYLWARERIRLISDYAAFDHDSVRIKNVTELGLRYNLLTNYTSFIAVHDKVRNKTGEDTSLVMPVPLPEGLNNNALASAPSLGAAVIVTGGIPGSYGDPSGGVLSIGSYKMQSLSCCEVACYVAPVPDITTITRPFHTYSMAQLKVYDDLYQAENLRGDVFMLKPLFTGSSISDQTLNAAYPGPWLDLLSYSIVSGSLVDGYELGNGRKEISFTHPHYNELNVHVRGNRFGRFDADVLAGRKLGERVSSLLLLHGDMNKIFTDRNRDGFADLPTGSSGMLAHEWKYGNAYTDSGVYVRHRSGIFLSHVGQESGELGAFRADRFQPRYLISRRAQHGGFYHQSAVQFKSRHQLLFHLKGTSSDIAAQAGAQTYLGQEKRMRTSLSWTPARRNGGWYFDFGASFTAADLREQVGDSSGTRQELISGIHAEASCYKLSRFTLKAGSRLDHHNLFGLLFTPLLKMKYDFSERFSVDAQGHGGYRVMNPVADNLHLLQSAKTISVLETLRPEHSYVYGGGPSYLFNERCAPA